MASCMRYDLFYNYMVKVDELKRQDKLDAELSKNKFKMGDINEDISVLQENFERFQPIKVQSKLCSLVCLVMMVYIAWKYAIVVLFGFMFVQIFTNVTNARIENRDEDLAQKVNMLQSKSQQ